MLRLDNSPFRLPDAVAAAWLVVFFGIALLFGSVRQLGTYPFVLLALAGLLYAVAFERPRLADLLRGHRMLLVSAALVPLAIFVADRALGAWKPQQVRFALPYQLGMFLCVAPLAVMLSRRRLLQGVVALFAAVTLFHLFALPYEAITGATHGQGEALYPRKLGPLNFQAHGLAWQVYYFPGLFLGMFYLAAGAIGEERAFGSRRMTAVGWLVVSLAWALAVACLQSRSAFAGALAASLIGLLAFAHVRRAGVLLLAAAVAVAGVALFIYLFSENKSSGGLRFAYMLLYLRRSFDPEWLLTGRGYSIVPDTSMVVPGLQYLFHAHNDVAQVAFHWGVPVLAVYLVFWFALVRLAARYWREQRYWPVLALVAVGPNLLTDLGIHNMEKAAFITVFAAMSAALWRPAAGQAADNGAPPPGPGAVKP